MLRGGGEEEKKALAQAFAHLATKKVSFSRVELRICKKVFALFLLCGIFANFELDTLTIA